MIESREALPCWTARDAFLRSVKDSEVVILSGETGSGKTTQMPQFLVDDGYAHHGYQIACTQPRRVAAISVAARVAEERRVKLGQEVGYSIRFDDKTSPTTLLKYMTDGMLVREAVLDSGMFAKYSVVILDEIHERSLHTDILLGLVSQAVKKRRDSRVPLKLVIMSATMTIDSFKQYFALMDLSCDTLVVPGRAFPVTIYHTEEVEHDYVEATVCTIQQINEDEHEMDGDILVFLPGQDDIEAVSASLIAHSKNENKKLRIGQKTPTRLGGRNLVVVHLFAALSTESQNAAFVPVPTRTHRKVILATNVAETSVTIPGIRYVIDCGLVKMKSIIGGALLEVLRIVPASKAAVTQRAGRAGREAPGKCFRLYRKKDYEKLADQTPPEITRCELATVLLQITAMGVLSNCSFANFPFLDKPSESAMNRAELILCRLGAITPSCKNAVTEYGKQLAAFPLHPLLAHMVLTSREFECEKDALVLASILSVDNLYKGKVKGGRSSCGDHWNLVSIFREVKAAKQNDKDAICKRHGVNSAAFAKAAKIISQLEKILKQVAKREPMKIVDESGKKRSAESLTADSKTLSKCLAKALWLNVAKLVKKQGAIGQYETLEKVECYIHPGSSVFGLQEPPECVVFTEIVQTSKNYLRGVTPIDGEWLMELVPKYFRRTV